MKKFISVMLVLVILTGVSISLYAKKKPIIEIAILLDTSGSMQGLIEQAKSQLWKIVNELAIAKKEDETPILKVGLYEYGKDSIPASEGYLRMILPLTTDLDKVSEELFVLKTYGGSEYCGRVIESATKGLQWSRNNKDLKMIFIAGNEPFTQGDVDYKKACKEAIKNSIIVNTIFCGDNQQGINTKWKDGADLCDGQYSYIDHNQKIAHIKAPQDDEIIKLNKELNKTYIAYGIKGTNYKARQKEQDESAGAMSAPVLVERSIAKASKHYKNESWDLVDAEKNGIASVEELEEQELPKVMQKMNKKERKAYVGKMSKKRERIQKKISKLNQERRKYVEKARNKLAKNSTLDSVIIRAIHKQAEKKAFEF